MNLVKQPIDGGEREILKSGATFSDLHAEVARLQSVFGYRLEPSSGGNYVAVHPFFAGKFALRLDPDDASTAGAGQNGPAATGR